MSFSAQENAAIRGLTVTGAAVSMVFSLGIVANYLFLKAVRSTPYKLVMLLSCADLLASLSFMVDAGGRTQADATACTVAAFLSQAFHMSAFLWTLTVALGIYAILVLRLDRARMHVFVSAAMGVNFGVPVTLALIALLLHAYGDAGLYCWIVPARSDLRLGLFYVPLMLIMLACWVIFFQVRFALRSAPASQQRSVVRRLLLYVSVFTFARLWSVANRLYEVANPAAPPVFFLGLMHAIFSPLQGTANALVYGANRRVLAEYERLFGPSLAAVGLAGCLAGRERGVDTVNPVANIVKSYSDSGQDIRDVRLSIADFSDRAPHPDAARRPPAPGNGNSGGRVAPPHAMGVEMQAVAEGASDFLDVGLDDADAVREAALSFSASAGPTVLDWQHDPESSRVDRANSSFMLPPPPAGSRLPG